MYASFIFADAHYQNNWELADIAEIVAVYSKILVGYCQFMSIAELSLRVRFEVTILLKPSAVVEKLERNLKIQLFVLYLFVGLSQLGIASCLLENAINNYQASLQSNDHLCTKSY